MRKIIITAGLILLAYFLPAQTFRQYGFKLQSVFGNIIPHDKHVSPLVEDPVRGVELSVEFQTMGDENWQQFNHFPVVGLGAVWLNLGNPSLLGNAYALYPYIRYPLIRSPFFSLHLKGGMGASYLTETFYTTNPGLLLEQDDNNNGAVGSHLNVYFACGGVLEIPIAKGFSLSAEYTWNHMSNGNAVVPNSGINLLNGFVGLKYFPNYKKFNFPVPVNRTGIPRKISYEIVASGGFRQLFYKDHKTFPIGSLVLAAYRPVANFLRMGVGVDAFYDGAFDGATLSPRPRTYLFTNELKNKIRVGVSWQNELLLGRMTAGFHLGLYLYNPIKNLEPYADAANGTLHKSLIYPYDIDKEDGWFYTRASLKYMIDKHFFISMGLKTHLQKAEFIEWGLGYRF